MWDDNNLIDLLVLQMKKLLLSFTATLSLVLLSQSQIAIAQEKSIVVSSTTSTEQSGLFGYLLPIFVEEGYSTQRNEVMYNDFVLIGPKADPAKIGGGKDIQAALQKIAATQTPFISRGDKSGTHAAELRYWKGAGVEVSPSSSWYKETGSGMGPALNTASAMNGYILSDRATWLTFKNRGDLSILVQGDPKLFNQYGVMLVNPVKYPQVKKSEGQVFIDWLISKDGQDTIASYKVGGEQLFFPNAKK